MWALWIGKAACTELLLNFLHGGGIIKRSESKNSC